MLVLYQSTQVLHLGHQGMRQHNFYGRIGECCKEKLQQCELARLSLAEAGRYFEDDTPSCVVAGFSSVQTGTLQGVASFNLV